MSLEFEGSVLTEHGHFSFFGRKDLYGHALFAPAMNHCSAVVHALAHQSPMIDLNFVLASGAQTSEIIL